MMETEKTIIPKDEISISKLADFLEDRIIELDYMRLQVIDQKTKVLRVNLETAFSKGALKMIKEWEQRPIPITEKEAFLYGMIEAARVMSGDEEAGGLELQGRRFFGT